MHVIEKGIMLLYLSSRITKLHNLSGIKTICLAEYFFYYTMTTSYQVIYSMVLRINKHS